jgi:hypothetical protein
MERLVLWSMNRTTLPHEGAPTAESDFKPGAILDWGEGVGVEQQRRLEVVAELGVVQAVARGGLLWTVAMTRLCRG